MASLESARARDYCAQADVLNLDAHRQNVCGEPVSDSVKSVWSDLTKGDFEYLSSLEVRLSHHTEVDNVCDLF